MTDEAVLRYASEVQHEIEAAITDEAPFSEEVFTHYLLERL